MSKKRRNPTKRPPDSDYKDFLDSYRQMRKSKDMRSLNLGGRRRGKNPVPRKVKKVRPVLYYDLRGYENPVEAFNKSINSKMYHSDPNIYKRKFLPASKRKKGESILAPRMRKLKNRYKNKLSNR